jgi:hypothetical protein
MTADASRRKSAEKPAKARRVFAARTVLFWERLWPVVVLAAAPLFLYLVLSLFAAWRQVPAPVQWMAALLALSASAFSVWRHRFALRWPEREEALERLEEGGGLQHAPLRAIEDRPFGAAETALWRAHISEMERRAAAARLKGPYAVADAVDPFALRFAALGLLVVALTAAGGDWRTRIAEGLQPGAARAGAKAFADLWIEPPAYTGKAPIYLLKSGRSTRPKDRPWSRKPVKRAPSRWRCAEPTPPPKPTSKARAPSSNYPSPER